MFTREQINNWIQLYQTSDNCIFAKENVEPNQFANRPFLKRDLVEAKVMVDRWDLVTTDWIFHTSKAQMIRALFPEEGYEKSEDSDALKKALQVLVKYAAILELDIDLAGRKIEELTQEELNKIAHLSARNQKFYIWGAEVHFTDDIDPNMAIGVSLDPKGKLMSNASNDEGANSIVVFSVA